MTASDRLSAFDRHICDIPNKGSVLNHMSAWWFKNTSHIIDNHYVYSNDKYMIVNKCNPIKLEFVVRGYMTGSIAQVFGQCIIMEIEICMELHLEKDIVRMKN